MGAPDGLRVIDVNSVYAMAEVDRCMLIVWRLQPTSEAFKKRHEQLIDLAGRHKGQCGYIEVIEPESKPPSDENRKAGVEAFRKLGKDLSAVAFVVDGPQFRSALVRTILTGMTFLIQQMQPSKVFKRVSDAATWIGPHMGADNAEFAARVVAGLEYLRAAKTI